MGKFGIRDLLWLMVVVAVYLVSWVSIHDMKAVLKQERAILEAEQKDLEKQAALLEEEEKYVNWKDVHVERQWIFLRNEMWKMWEEAVDHE